MSQYSLTVHVDDGNTLFAEDVEMYWNFGRAEREAIKISRMYPGTIVKLTELVANGTTVLYRYGRKYKAPRKLSQ